MSIPTTRAKEKAGITIYPEKCNGCGLCVTVCKDFSLQMAVEKVALTEDPLFGCIGCGHCMAICPTGAIEIHGRELSPDDLFNLSKKEMAAGYDELLNLLKRRRSMREFKEIPVEKELIDKILNAASTSPMGIPPSDVNILILDSPEKVRKFSKAFCAYLESIQWLVSKWFLTLMRPFLSKANNDLFAGLSNLYLIFTLGT